MAIGDTVRIGTAGNGIGNIPVYLLKREQSGALVLTHSQAAIPYVVGGVKAGSLGKITGNSVVVERQSLVGVKENMTAPIAADYVPLYPVFVEAYGQEAWIPGDFFKIVG